jgi:imidazolonepropionase-like amidohydrolase
MTVFNGIHRALRSAAALLTCVALASCASGGHIPEATDTTAYTNGRWYDGDAFFAGDMYVRDGAFVPRPRGAPGQVIDLRGAYVTPAFAEGHHHTVICDEERIGQFVDAGVLYAAIMAAALSTEECRAQNHGAGSVEIVSAIAAITAPNAHPSQIGLYWLQPDQLDPEWVHLADDPGDLDRIFARIDEHRPDFIKLILSYSEDYARLRDDASLPSWYRGIDPSLVPLIVERAHARGLRVAAHVMSGRDFTVAVNGGVDIIAHMPGFAPGNVFTPDEPHPYLAALTPDSPVYRIARQDAERARARGVVVVTTLNHGAGPSAAANVSLLREVGVPLLIGSDAGEGNAVDEAIALVEGGLMPAAEVLRALTVTTPRYFFPERRIGAFRPGAEATFVVLRADPLADIHNLRAPLMVVQRGTRLRPRT